MKDTVIVLIIVAVVVAALYYIISQKKKGAKCIGCPASKTCKRCNCHSDKT